MRALAVLDHLEQLGGAHVVDEAQLHVEPRDARVIAHAAHLVRVRARARARARARMRVRVGLGVRVRATVRVGAGVGVRGS